MTKTDTFRSLHAPGSLLVLPNAWDVATARLAEDAGAAAVATTSAGVAWSLGAPDGDHLDPGRAEVWVVGDYPLDALGVGFENEQCPGVVLPRAGHPQDAALEEAFERLAVGRPQLEAALVLVGVERELDCVEHQAHLWDM